MLKKKEGARTPPHKIHFISPTELSMDNTNFTLAASVPQVNPAELLIRSYAPRHVIPFKEAAKILGVTSQGLRKAVLEKRVNGLPIKKVIGGLDCVVVGDLAKFLYPEYFPVEKDPPSPPQARRGRGRPRLTGGGK